MLGPEPPTQAGANQPVVRLSSVDLVRPFLTLPDCG